jgi:PAP2 superfamily protein
VFEQILSKRAIIRWAELLVLAATLTNMAVAWQGETTGLWQSRPQAADVPPVTTENGKSSLPKQSSSTPDKRDQIFYPGDTERLKPLGRKLALNIVLDQKEILTSPFHINRRTAPMWLLSAGTIAGLIAADRHIADAFENSRGQTRWGERISTIGASYTVVPLVAGYYGYGVWKDNPKAREIGVLGTESLVDSLIVAGILKEAFRRDRPDEKEPGEFWEGGRSFPSGHAIQMWSIASLVAHEYKHKPVVQIAAYSLAGIVSVSRVAAQKHFASDVVAGGAMGWFIGRYVYETHMSHLAHKHATMMPMIVPQIEPLQHRFTVMLVLGRTAPTGNGDE